jgi:haloalkane dehalogenase
MATVVLPETTRANYPFQSQYLMLDDAYRMHFVDEGPEQGDTLVFLHSYPLWSFEYRALIAYYAAQNFRCVAMDYIGCGLSDKPAQRRYHTAQQHLDNFVAFMAARELRDVTLVMEDWGGPVGLGYALRHVENVKRLVIMNTWVFEDTYENRLNPLIRWATRPGLGELLFGSVNFTFLLGTQRWTARQLSSAVLSAYKAPFRDRRNRAALIQFPRMINTSPQHPSTPLMREIEQGLAALRRVPTLLLWGENDPLLPADIARHWKRLLPRARGPVVIENARHYLTEDAPERLTRELDAFLDGTA